MTLSKVLACSAMLNERSKNTAHYFHTHLLSDYFLLSARPLLSEYFLAVSGYNCMHLTTNAYGMSTNCIGNNVCVMELSNTFTLSISAPLNWAKLALCLLLPKSSMLMLRLILNYVLVRISCS